MKKLQRKLTKAQKRRGVVFSSQLVVRGKNKGKEDYVIEVFEDEDQLDQNIVIYRLLNSEKEACWTHNIIRR